MLCGIVADRIPGRARMGVDTDRTTADLGPDARLLLPLRLMFSGAGLSGVLGGNSLSGNGDNVVSILGNAGIDSALSAHDEDPATGAEGMRALTLFTKKGLLMGGLLMTLRAYRWWRFSDA